MELKQAQRKQAKLRIGLAGPSGSGKTYSALLLARGLASAWEKIAIIDTENGSASLYSHLGAFNDIILTTFKPSDYIAAIQLAEKEGMEVIIIDSVTAEWKYILEAVDKITQASPSKNSYTAWGKATPMHDAFIQSILQSKCHVVTTVRSKQDYLMGVDNNGKKQIQKVGMKQETRDGFEYELTISLDLEHKTHLATVSKDRTSLFDSEIAGFLITEETGRTLKAWNEQAPLEGPKILTATEAQQLFNE